jgi:hypothetical protein
VSAHNLERASVHNYDDLVIELEQNMPHFSLPVVHPGMSLRKTPWLFRLFGSSHSSFALSFVNFATFICVWYKQTHTYTYTHTKTQTWLGSRELLIECEVVKWMCSRSIYSIGGIWSTRYTHTVVCVLCSCVCLTHSLALCLSHHSSIHTHTHKTIHVLLTIHIYFNTSILNMLSARTMRKFVVASHAVFSIEVSSVGSVQL